MPAHPPNQPACTQSYALRLRAPAEASGTAPPGPCGRIEHVLSGECRDFDSAPGLLAALAALQELAYSAPRSGPMVAPVAGPEAAGSRHSAGTPPAHRLTPRSPP